MRGILETGSLKDDGAGALSETDTGYSIKQRSELYFVSFLLM